jgi:hypothetical protein
VYTSPTQERAINGENLKLLNTFLEPPASHNPFASHRSGIRHTDASPRHLHFYLKPQPLPARVTVPLDSDRAQVFTALRDILQAHCKGLALPAVPVQLQPQHQQQPQTPPGYDDGFGGRHRYGDAWARARANARRRRRSWQEHAGGGFAGGREEAGEEDEDEGVDEEERPPPFLDLHLETAARREEKWGTMQVRASRRSGV